MGKKFRCSMLTETFLTKGATYRVQVSWGVLTGVAVGKGLLAGVEYGWLDEPNSAMLGLPPDTLYWTVFGTYVEELTSSIIGGELLDSEC